MRLIYKYPFAFKNETAVELPQGARILTVQLQHSYCCLWAEVDPDKPLELRRLRVFGTGHELPEPPECLRYLGTIQVDGGNGIFHIFEELEV